MWYATLTALRNTNYTIRKQEYEEAEAVREKKDL